MSDSETISDSAALAAIIVVQRFVRDDGGATAIEYAVIASGVAVAIAATITALGSNVTALFSSVSDALK